MAPLAPASSVRERSRVTVSPVLARFAGLAAVGLLAARLPRRAWRRTPGLDVLLAAGGPLVLVGVALGPGIELLDRPTLRLLAPLTALALGWIGATLGARFEWRYLRRIPPGIWLLAALEAASAFLSVAFGAALLARLRPALAAAWIPRLPAILTLAAAAAAAGPGAAVLVARIGGIRPRVARAVARVALIEAGCAALALTVPLALHRAHASTESAELGWVAWLAFTTGGGALIALVFQSLTRLQPGRAELGFALLAALLFGAGIGYAADLSPFLVCALAAAVIVNVSPRRHVVRQVLSDSERAAYAGLLVITGALLRLPTAWLLVAAPLLAGLRAAVKWGVVSGGRFAFPLPEVAPGVGLGTVAQGGVALACGLTFALVYGGLGPGAAGAMAGAGSGGGAVLATVVLAVAVTDLAAPGLMGFLLRAGPAPLTPRPVPPELSATDSAEWPR
jgi:hypothetical protein